MKLLVELADLGCIAIRDRAIGAREDDDRHSIAWPACQSRARLAVEIEQLQRRLRRCAGELPSLQPDDAERTQMATTVAGETKS